MTAHHGTMLASLVAAGVEPAEVTDVVFTHLHFDHIGWASADGVVTLKGQVDSLRERDAAEQLARETAGVKRVVNQMKVAAR